MNDSRAHRRHAVRVAAVATLIVMVFYVIAAIVMNLIVTQPPDRHDRQPACRSARGRRQQTLALPAIERTATRTRTSTMHRSFLWSIAPSGTVTALTPTAPPLPARHWGPDPVTLGDRQVDLPVRHAAGPRCRAGGRSEPAATANVAVDAAGGRARLRRDPGGRRLLRCDGRRPACVGTIGARPSPTGRVHRRRVPRVRTPISVIEAEVGLALDRPRVRRPTGTCWNGWAGRAPGCAGSSKTSSGWPVQTASRPTPVDADVADVGRSGRGAVRSASVRWRRRTGWTSPCERVGTGPFTVQAQPDLIDRLAGVLIDNACKFAGDGGRVEVSVRDWGTRVELRVDDSGPGIPEEQRDAVFDRFHRASD